MVLSLGGKLSIRFDSVWSGKSDILTAILTFFLIQFREDFLEILIFSYFTKLIFVAQTDTKHLRGSLESTSMKKVKEV